jgi:hypothetical protein
VGEREETEPKKIEKKKRRLDVGKSGRQQV